MHVRILGFLLLTVAACGVNAADNSGPLASPIDRAYSRLYNFDFNTWMAGGLDPLLLPGTMVEAQFYSRDPGFGPPNNIGLTNALEFTVLP